MPRYLEQAMTNFARQQQQMRQTVEQTLSPFLPRGVEEMGRQNMAMFERAMSMWNPFHRDEPEGGEQQAEGGAEQGDAALRQEIESLREQLAAAQSQNQTPAPSADPAEVEVMRNEIDRLRHQLAAAQSQGPAPAPSADPAELDALRRELGDVRHQLRPRRRQRPRTGPRSSRLQHEVDSLNSSSRPRMPPQSPRPRRRQSCRKRRRRMCWPIRPAPTARSSRRASRSRVRRSRRRYAELVPDERRETQQGEAATVRTPSAS